MIVTKSYVEDKPIFTKTSVFHILATEDTIYKPIFEKLEEYILAKPISKPAIFHPSTANSLQPYSYETLEDGSRIKHNHFHVPLYQLPGIYVSETANQDIAKINSNVVALLQLDETYIEPIEIVLEIIENTGLYRANEQRKKLYDYLDFIKNTPTIIIEDYYNCVFYNSFKIPNIFMNTDLCKELCNDNHNYESVSFPTLINTALGQLIKYLRDGMDIEEAVSKYLNMVDAQNYQRPKKIITTSMVNQAEKRLKELDYLESIPHRYATIDDLPIQEVDYINKNNTQQKEETIFDELRKDAVEKPANFDYIKNEGYYCFKEQEYKNIELYFDPKLRNHLVSLIAPVNKDSKSLFKWDNNFSWSYKGNFADSIKENVKKAGGKIEGALRFSLQWNDEEHYNSSDLDAHCTISLKHLTLKEEDREIFYAHEKNYLCGKDGGLDVDIINPHKGVPAVENIIFTSLDAMEEGTYKFRVHMYHRDTVMDNFKCEIEFDGNIYNYEYRQDMTEKEYVDVATVTLDENGFSINHHLPLASESNAKLWNIKLNSFVPVKAIMTSPNYWGWNKSGLKHLFIFLEGCENDSQPNVWYNEFLNSELHDEKRVMNVMASQVKVDNNPNQLSGIGISVDKETKLTFRCDGEIHNVIVNHKEV